MTTDKLSVIEGNKIIAEFLNAPIDTKGADESAWVKRPDKELSRWTLLSDLKYHSSWDWLMPVVEKIEKCANYNKENPYYSVEGFEINYSRQYPHYTTSVRIPICTKLNGIGSEFHYIETKDRDKINAVWLAVVEFIKWYNQNNK